MKMKISEIQKPPWYFRQDMGADLDTLAVSLLAGQEEPIEVYEVDGVWYTVDGWRRISAAFLAGMEEIEVRKYKGDDPLLSALVRATFDRSHDHFEKGEGYWRWLEKRIKKMDEVTITSYRNLSSPVKGGVTPENFVRSYVRSGGKAFAELNEALGDPLGQLEKAVGSLATIGTYLRAYNKASEGVKKHIRSGAISPTTGQEIAFGLPKYPKVQDRVAEKCAERGLGKSVAAKACKVLRKVIKEYDDDEEAIDAVLEDDWTQTEDQLLRGVGIWKEIMEHMDGQDFYDEAPEFKALLKTFKELKRQVRGLFEGLQDAAWLDKLSPEGKQFVIEWLADLANSAADLAASLGAE